MSEEKLGVVGAGYWGRNLVRVFAGLDVELTVVDTQPSRLREMVRLHGCATAASFDALIDDKQLQAVVIASPAQLHGSMVRRALLAGKDVMVEKPLSLSAEEGDELVAIASDQGRILMVGHLLWYHPAVLRLKELVAGGSLGRLQYLYSNRLNLGKIRRNENILWSFAPHDVSVILGLVGEMPERVEAQGGYYLNSEIADVTVSLMSFVSGIKAHVFVSWLHPFKEQRLVVVGDEAMAVFEDTVAWPRKLRVYRHSIDLHPDEPVPRKAEAEFIAHDEAEPLRQECAHFLECIRTRSKPRTDGAEGVRVLRVLQQCQADLEARIAE